MANVITRTVKYKKGILLKTGGKYCENDINVIPDSSLFEKNINLQEKEITENGEYVADQGYDGFSKVTVNVESEIKLNPVTNIALSSGGVLSWDAPDTTDIADKLVSISYVINVNGTELTSDTNSVNVKSSLVEGDNTVSVKAIVSLYNEETQSVIEYEAPAEPVAILLEIKLPTGLGDTSAVSIGTNAYIFGGYSNGKVNQILKFDSVSETVTTLSAVLPSNRERTTAVSIGTNAYIFGGLGTVKLKDILKFDSVSETVTTLSAVLPFVLMAATAVSIGTNAYIFGGISDSNSNQILKFDSVSETVTTLSAVLPKAMYDTSAVSIGTNAYIFGGRISIYSGSKDILKFDSVSETVTTLSVMFSQDSYDTTAVSIETNAYIFGGPNILNKILKFDSVSETVTTLSAVLPISGSFSASAVSIETNAYIFGGYLDSKYLDIIIKVSNL